MLQALMVDVDGVLVKGRPGDGRDWAADLEADLGLRRDDLVREFFQPCWNDIVVGKADLVACLTPVLAELAPHLQAGDLITYWFERDSALDTVLLESLSRRRAAGMQVHLATNQEHLRARYLMQEMRFEDHVDSIFYSAEMGCRKPELRFFELAGRRIGVPACQILLIDDTPANVAAARETGWQALCWQGDMSLDEELLSFAGGPAPTA